MTTIAAGTVITGVFKAIELIADLVSMVQEMSELDEDIVEFITTLNLLNSLLSNVRYSCSRVAGFLSSRCSYCSSCRKIVG